MTVAELVALLQTYPQDAEVLGMDPLLRLGSYGTAGVTLGYAVDLHGRILMADPNEPEARVVVHIG